MKLSHFGHNDRKYRLVNTVTASFNNITGQMTETSQRNKQHPQKQLPISGVQQS